MNDEEFQKFLEQVEMMDAQQFEDLLFRLMKIAAKTGDGEGPHSLGGNGVMPTHRGAWTKTSVILLEAAMNVRARAGN